MEKREDNYLKGDGILMPLCVHADNLAEAAHKAIIACYDNGARVKTPKHRQGMSLGYDAPIIIGIRNADAEPKVYFPAMHDSPLGALQYILEVTHGIHNHWKKTPEEPHFWGYTYNERFVDQLPFIFQRIKADWDKKQRITGRDYQFDIWRAGEDIILEQEDPPCFQRGVLRFLKNKNGDVVMNYLTSWRSRDELKAWNQNNTGQIGCKEVPGLMRLLRDKVSNMLEIPIKLGSYIDYSDSLHLYGLYVDRDNLDKQIQQMRGYKDDEDFVRIIKEKRDLQLGGPKWKKALDSLLKPINQDRLSFWIKDQSFLNSLKEVWNSNIYKKKSMGLEEYLLMNKYSLDIKGMKKLIAAQMDAETERHGKQKSKEDLIKLGYDIDNFPYPEEWDTWPKSWDAEPDPSKLARIL